MITKTIHFLFIFGVCLALGGLLLQGILFLFRTFDADPVRVIASLIVAGSAGIAWHDSKDL